MEASLKRSRRIIREMVNKYLRESELSGGLTTVSGCLPVSEPNRQADPEVRKLIRAAIERTPVPGQLKLRTWEKIMKS